MSNRKFISSMLIAAFLFFILISAFVIDKSCLHITAAFEDFEHCSCKLPVYFKGFKIGKVTGIYLSEDCSETYVDMIIYKKNIQLPCNIIAKLKPNKRGEYIELIYPKSNPSDCLLQNHDIIEGRNSFNLSDYIDKQAEEGGLEELKEKLKQTADAATGTFNAFTDFMVTGNEILKDVRPNLKESSELLVQTSKNIEDLTAQLSRSTRSEKLQRSSFNLEQSTESIKKATKNLEIASENINDITINIKDETVSSINSTFGNINSGSKSFKCIMNQVERILKDAEEIVKGVKITLSKRFSGIRIMFGKTVY